jgi:hypothetical protein
MIGSLIDFTELCLYMNQDTLQLSWLRHYAKSRMVTGSITDVIGFSIYLVLPVALMAPGFIQPLKEMSTRLTT